MTKNISILGSTGSIGINTLDIVRAHPKRFSVKALAAKCNAELLLKQAREFRPQMVCIMDSSKAVYLEKELKPLKIKVVTGSEGLSAVAALKSVEQVVVAIVGVAGLIPIFDALKAGKDLAVANKEPLVVAGRLLMREAEHRKINIFPIDSEHSGLWQCLHGQKKDTVKKLILTSSGGPFRKFEGSLKNITREQALNHPKWKMGPKITIDSATLMNKGLEVIEAVHLFKMNPAQVDVLIHPEAIVHALIEFVDGSHLAHLSVTDMRLPIQYALTYPDRLVNHLPTLDLIGIKNLSFEKPNRGKFPCLELGYEAVRAGGSMPAVLNAANEAAVEGFLNGKITFLKIPKLIEKSMRLHKVVKNPDLQTLIQIDQVVREQTEALIGS